MKHIIETPEEKKIKKLQKKYPGAKIIDGGSFANIKDPKERIEAKILKLRSLFDVRKISNSQQLRLNEARDRFKIQKEKIDKEIEEVKKSLRFWGDKSIETLEESIDLQLEILNE